MKALIDVFRMNEISPKVRARLIVELGILINGEYQSNVTEPLVAELVHQLDPDNIIFKSDCYSEHLN